VCRNNRWGVPLYVDELIFWLNRHPTKRRSAGLDFCNRLLGKDSEQADNHREEGSTFNESSCKNHVTADVA
jgi:hypothetical protein